jgi:hypothetical protein
MYLRVGQLSAVIKVVVVDELMIKRRTTGLSVVILKKLRRTWHSVINVGYDDGVESEVLLTGFEG